MLRPAVGFGRRGMECRILAEQSLETPGELMCVAMKLGVAMLVTTLSACSGSSESGNVSISVPDAGGSGQSVVTTGVEPPVSSTTTSVARELAVGEASAAELMDAMSGSGDFGLTAERAECFAKELIAVIGEERLVELGATSGAWAVFDGAAGFTASERTAVTEAYLSCVPDWEKHIMDESLDEALARCWVDSVLGSGITLEQILFAEVDENEVAVGMASLQAWDECGHLDPGP